VIELVVDTSALIVAMTGRSPEAKMLQGRLQCNVCHAPHLIDAEAGNVLRRLVRTGAIGAQFGLTALRAVRDAIDERHPHSGSIAETAWSSRDNLTYYDGLYVALAAELDLSLVTADRRLARAPGLPRSAELV